MAETNNKDNTVQVQAGSKLYHWRYGSMTVKEDKGDYIILDIDDISKIKTDEKLLDPWRNRMGDKTKKFPKSAIDKWLFKVPERVGSSKPAYGDRSFLSDEVFIRKLNNEFQEEAVMECKNNYAQYLAKSKSKAEKVNEESLPEDHDDIEINAKEIEELYKIKSDYILAKEEKEEEVSYITKKLEDYESQLANLEANINRCKRKISEKEKRIVVKENELDKLENEASNNAYNKNQGAIIDIESEIRRLEDGIDELRGEVNEAGRNIEKITKEQTKSLNKKNTLSKEIADLNNKIIKLETDIEVLT